MTEHVAISRRARVAPRFAAVLAVLGLLLVGGPAALLATAPPARAASGEAAEQTPLQVTIDGLTPGYLPARGRVVVTGTVTNRSQETWTGVRVYPFFGTAPLRNAAELERATATPEDADVGPRLTGPGDYRSVGSLAPGASTDFRLEIPAGDLTATEPGVYWFGVHALGASPSQPSDNFADGRARTFLPYLPRSVTVRRGVDRSVPTALVEPVVRSVAYAADGSVDEPASWARTLASGGRLRDAVDFGSAASVPLTWLVDPAVVDAVARLAAGNPGRSLDAAPTTPSTRSPSSSPTSPASPTSAPASPSASPTNPFLPPADDSDDSSDSSDSGGSGSTGGGSGAGSSGSVSSTTATAANAWLRALPGAVADDQVLGLPYGNLDVPAALRLDPALFASATSTRSPELDALGISTSPALASPSGYLDAATIAEGAGGDGVPASTVLVTDQQLPGPRPGLASVDGQPVVVTSSTAAEGGPGPGPRLTAIALRQRVLAEAAVRLLKNQPAPLTVVLPTNGDISDPAALFGGLATVPWLDLDTVGQLAASSTTTTVSADELTYPARQRHRQIDGATFRAADNLLASGDLLAGVLTDRSDLAAELTRQALSATSFAMRSDQLGTRSRLTAADDWVDQRLGSVQISAPRGVTLSSASGKFAATLTNRLDVPVTVGVVASSDAGLEISDSRQVQLGPGSHTTVLLEARATSNKVHNVTLRVVDDAGRPIGAVDQLPIRSAQVSNVIWLIMGTGAVLLFGAIAVRLVRRILRSGIRSGLSPGRRPGLSEPR